MPAFLFTDIEGSTRLWEQHSQVMPNAISRHNELIRTNVEQNGGQIVKSTGDGFLILFEQGNPLDCAIELQLAFQEESWPEEIGPLRIRIGVHSGTFELREGDIYGADVNRAARVMDAGWGGQILITDDAKIDYKLPKDATLLDLGAHILKDLGEPQQIFGLLHPRLIQEFPPLRSLSAQPNNLPILATSFVGRQEDIKEIGDLLRNNTCRLITLHGPGGIGKTRLSIQSGITFLKHYPYGVYFVPLAPLNNPDDIWPTIASSINLPIYQEKTPKDQVLNYLKHKKLLLILDNFEHLQSGAHIINELLESAPNLQVMATSRNRLQLLKECVFEVDGLQFPPGADAEIFEDFEAVQLFTIHAQKADPGFQLRSSDFPAIVEICTLMDGMPLGIELAAQWVRVISPQEIVEELRQDIDLLKTELVDVPERHRSMRAIFDYSWKLLDDDEKRVLKALSVFRDGCTFKAAKVVAGASLRVVSGLVDKSLVKKNSLGRYEMHELIRQLAEEKLLEDREEHHRILEGHSQYFLTTLAERESDLKGNDQINALQELEADFENLRLAWYTAIQTDQPQLAAGAIESYHWLLTYRNHHAAGQELFERARQKWADPSINPSLYHHLRIRFPKEDQELKPIYQLAVDSARSRGDKFDLAIALNQLGRYYGHHLQDEEHGLKYLNESLEIFKQLGDDFYVGHVLDDISFTYLYIDLKARIEYAEKSLAVREKSKDLFGTASVLGNLVIGCFWDGKFAKVEEYSYRGLELAKQTNDIRNIAWQLVYISEIRQFEGNFEDAMEMILEAEKICHDIYDSDLMIQVNINKATIIAVSSEDYLQAKEIMENTIPLDAEFSMHKPNATLTYGLIAAGLGDQEVLNFTARFPFEAMSFTVTGSFGLSWFSPLIIVSLYLNENYVPAVECLGFTLSKGLITHGYIHKWTVIQRIKSELVKILGNESYQQALQRGQNMEIIDFRQYLIEGE